MSIFPKNDNPEADVIIFLWKQLTCILFHYLLVHDTLCEFSWLFNARTIKVLWYTLKNHYILSYLDLLRIYNKCITMSLWYTRIELTVYNSQIYIDSDEHKLSKIPGVKTSLTYRYKKEPQSCFRELGSPGNHRLVLNTNELLRVHFQPSFISNPIQ